MAHHAATQPRMHARAAASLPAGSALLRLLHPKQAALDSRAGAATRAPASVGVVAGNEHELLRALRLCASVCHHLTLTRGEVRAHSTALPHHSIAAPQRAALRAFRCNGDTQCMRAALALAWTRAWHGMEQHIPTQRGHAGALARARPPSIAARPLQQPCCGVCVS